MIDYDQRRVARRMASLQVSKGDKEAKVFLWLLRPPVNGREDVKAEPARVAHVDYLRIDEPRDR